MHEDGTAGQLTPAGTCAAVFGVSFLSICFYSYGSMQVIVYGTLILLFLQGRTTSQSMAVSFSKGERDEGLMPLPPGLLQ